MINVHITLQYGYPAVITQFQFESAVDYFEKEGDICSLMGLLEMKASHDLSMLLKGGV